MPGDTSAGALSRAVSAYNANQAGGPAIVLIGINDVIAGTSAATIEANLTAIAAALPSAPWFVCILPFGGFSSWTSGKEAIRVAVNTWIRANTVGYTDAEAIIGDSHPTQPRIKAEYTVAGVAAGLHLNADGQTALAAAVFAQSYSSTPITG